MRLHGFSGDMVEWEDMYSMLIEDFEKDVRPAVIGAFGFSAFAKYVELADLSDDFLWDAARMLAQENSGADFPSMQWTRGSRQAPKLAVWKPTKATGPQGRGWNCEK
jgi:hypothetical protein